MSAPIAHMLIAKRVRERLKAIPDTATFATNVLDAHSQYMALGSLGPDLPYFGLKSLFDPNLPIGVDAWSYQLHSRTPNIFPLHLIEVAGRTSDPTKLDWDETDDCKFSFLCGYLTHMAADQTIHPLVNAIAGSYYQDKSARKEHKNCEMHQDLYVLRRNTGAACAAPNSMPTGSINGATSGVTVGRPGSTRALALVCGIFPGTSGKASSHHHAQSSSCITSSGRLSRSTR